MALAVAILIGVCLLLIGVVIFLVALVKDYQKVEQKYYAPVPPIEWDWVRGDPVPEEEEEAYVASQRRS